MTQLLLLIVALLVLGHVPPGNIACVCECVCVERRTGSQGLGTEGAWASADVLAPPLTCWAA